MALKLKHQTEAQFIKRLRDAYRDAEGERAVQIARFIINSIQRGDIDDAKLAETFGINHISWAKLKSKMSGYIAAADSLKAIRGE